MNNKVVIIGSGLGGLSSGLILAKNGYDVTILEQCAQPGGCLQCFYRDGVKFETGMHFIGSASPGQSLHSLMSYLELQDVELSALDPDGYEVVSINGRRYKYANGQEAFINELAKDFPDQRDNLKQYFDLLNKISEASSVNTLRNVQNSLDICTEYQLRSINDVLDSIFTDPELKKVLVGNMPLYAAELNKTPFMTHAFISGSYNQSAYRVVGGSDRVTRSLLNSLEKYGAKVLTRSKVTEIVCDDTKATAVKTADGKIYNCDYLISAIHPAKTVALTNTSLLRPVYKKRMTSMPNTIGAFTLYLKFKPDAVPYMNHNFYSYSTDTPWGCEKYRADEWPKGYLYMHMCHEAKSKYARSGVVISYMDISELQPWVNTTVGRRGEDYERFKAEKADKLLQSLLQDFPELKENIDSIYSSTPLTYRDYTGTIDGSMYGVAKDVNAMNETRVAYRTRIPNLLLTGQNINSHGMLGVIVGAIETCSILVGAEKICRQIEQSAKRGTVLIIGGGLGGLFCGAILAKEGYVVDVLEKNAVPGGGLQTFKRWGETFETGMHILGGLRPGGSLYRICQYLGIDDMLEIKDVDAHCTDELHVQCEGKTYCIGEGREGFVHSLAEYFPEERENLKRYVDGLYEIVDRIDLFRLRPNSENMPSFPEEFLTPTDEFIANFISDPRLRQLLAYMNAMYGGETGHTPVYIHALINILYIEGASRFVGGSQQLANALCSVIEQNGGRIHVGAPAAKIEVHDRCITSVADNRGNKYRADYYISAIHPCTLLDLLPTSALPKAYANRLRIIPNSYSAFSVYIKLKPGMFKYINHTCYYIDEYQDMWNLDRSHPDWPRAFMYMTPPEANQGKYANKIVTNCIMSFDEVRKWENTKTGLRGADYLHWKQQKIDSVIKKLCNIYPDLTEMIEKVEAASPLTIRDFYGTKEGGLYGFKKDCKNIILSQVPPVTKIRNLMLTGQNTFLHGICGTPLTALTTAEILLGKNYVVDKINKKL